MATAGAKKRTPQGKKLSRASTVEQKKPRFVGWLSTDEEEIDRRRLRGIEETFRIETLEPGQPFFGTFRVFSSGETSYTVEILSLNQALDRRNNLCDCPDHQVNGLGTCKHIEAVLLKLRKGKLRKFMQAVQTGSPRVEIFLDRIDDRIRIHWPLSLDRKEAAGKLLEPFFASDGTLLAEPLIAMPALRRDIEAAAQPIRDQIRLSQHIEPWLRERRYRQERGRARELFLNDVEQGKRTMDVVEMPLYPYQQQGMLHLAFTERALLADEMGLGKTVQAVAACELLRRLKGIRRVLVISPASLKTEWEEQIAKFTDLPTQILQGSRKARLKQYRQPAFFYLTNYEQIRVDLQTIQEVLSPDIIILDEAQRIKNWQTKTAAAVKRLNSRYAFVLTGTPLENRIDEVYSIVQFLDPGIFGPLFRFNREFYQLDERGRPTGYQNLDELHRRLQPVMLRRRKEEVEGQLPGRTVNNYYVTMHPEQSTRYDEFSAEVAKITSAATRRPLTREEFEKLQKFLACMRMVCDTPYILDQECRVSPKLHELEDLLGDLLEDYETKIIIFSEWTRMLELIVELLQQMQLDYALHTGSVSQQKRREEINRFKNDPDCRLFLSTDSGSTGLNLQVANVVINVDLPWNPARLEQRIGRAWRKHQTRSVQVINLVCENSIEHRMLHMLDKKQALADSVLDGSGMVDMEMPSGRQAFVERLEGLMGRPAPAARASTFEEMPLPLHELADAAADTDVGQAADGSADKRDETKKTETPAIAAVAGEPLQRLKEDTVARLSDRVEQLQVYHRDGSQTVVAVLDRVDKTSQEVVEQAVQQQTPNARLELLDRSTFDAIQRLIDAGVLQLTEPGAQTLHQSADRGRQQNEERERRRREALQQFAEAERKRRMAGVLAAGGFPLEALAPMRQAIETALAALAHSLGEKNGEIIPLKMVESRLLKAGMVPQEAPSLVALLRQQEADDEETARTLFERGAGLLDHAAEALDRMALRV
jgi:superfamily II DNA or RNA helicase